MLDDSDDIIKRRLEGFEENPDEELWNKVQDRLSQSIDSRLRSYEEEPVPAAWEYIQNNLVESPAANLITYAQYVISLLAIVSVLIFPATTFNEKSSIVAFDRLSSKADSATTGMSQYHIPDSTSRVFLQKEKKDNEIHAVEIDSINNSVKSDISKRKVKPDKSKEVVVVSGIYDEKKPKRLRQVSSSEEIERLSDQQLQSPIEQAAENNITVFKEPEKLNDQNKESVSVESRSDSILNFQVLLNENEIKSADTLKSDSTKPPKRKRPKTGAKSEYYVLLMPTFGYQDIQPSMNDNILVQSLQKISAFSFDRLGIRAEIGWQRKITENLSVNAGLLYFQRKQTITYNYLDGTRTEAVTRDSAQLTYLIRPQTVQGSFEYELRNVGLILGLSYEISRGPISHRVGLGGELHKGLSRADLDLPSSNSLYIFGNVYYRISYRLTPVIDLIAQPTFNYSFKVSEQLNAPFYVKPYGIGLSLGASFHFGPRPKL